MNKAPIRVLIIEDDEPYQCLLRKTLEGSVGLFEVDAALLLSEGIKMAKDSEYDLILLDLNLPDSKGADTVARLHEVVPLMPIIVMSGQNSKDVIFDCLARGAQEYLVKDVTSLAALSRTIIHAIERKKVDIALKQGRDRWQALFQHNPMETIVVDLNGCVTDINFAKRSSDGRTPAIGDKMYLDYAPNHINDMRAELMNCLESGVAKDFPAQKYGSKVLSVQIAPFPRENPDGAVIISEDITERNQTSEELKVSEDKYRSLFEGMAQGVFYQQRDGSLADWNGAILDMWGITSDQFARKTSSDADWKVIQEDGSHYPAEDHPSVVALRTGKPILNAIAGVFNPKSKKIVWSSINAVPQFKPGENKPFQVFVTVHDVSALKETEERLKESEKRNAVWLTHSPVCTKILDPDFNTIYMSPAGINALKLNSMDDVRGKPYPFDFYPEEFKREMLKNLNHVKATGLIAEQEASIFDIEGNKMWFHSTIVPVFDDDRLDYMMVVSMDTTARRKTEEAVVMERDKAQEYLDIAEVMLIALDLDGTVTLINRKGCEILGYAESEILGRNWFDNFLPEGIKEDILDVAAKIISGERDAAAFVENPVLTKTGEERMIEWSTVELNDENGRITGHLSCGKDITERIKSEEQRIMMDAQMRQSQKLESIGTLAGGVAHEINNPINGIMNYAELIVDNLGPESPSSEFAAEIGKETKRVAEIVRNMLNFARPASESQTPEQMCDIVDATLILTRSVFLRDQVVIEVDVPETLPRVTCRSQQIQQVIMNLLTNARDALNDKYTGQGENKSICISSSVIEKAGKNWLRTTVEDRGTGIPEECREHLFDPFYTLKRPDRGTGLGLSISHSIVRDHGGALSVESVVGEYTRMHLDLPVSDQLQPDKEV